MESSRKIIHIDQDCFYAAVEMRDNPRLAGRPVAVGGNASGRGVLTTANYEARKFGVRSAMPTSRALRLCPQLILVPVAFEKYRRESQRIRKIFAEFTSKIEPLSLDEAYLDVTHCSFFAGSATLIAKEIRRRIFEETQLTASAGIASNKFLAKVASDWRKPNGQFTITPDQTSAFVRQLVVEKIPGVGSVTAKRMHGLGIRTCEDLQKMKVEELSYTFGSWGLRLYDLSRGIDDRPVSSGGLRKSLTVERTFSEDLPSAEACSKHVAKMFEEFTHRFEKADVQDRVKSLVVKVKFFDFQQTTLERSELKIPSIDVFQEMVMEAVARQNKPVRLLGLGVRLSAPKTNPRTRQLGLF